MSLRAFQQVDVFTAKPLLGNPVAVVLDGSGLSAQQMQAFTDWTNLSEATFILPPLHPAADYRVRIFSPGRELPFAGHPTLGTCHAWLQAGGRPRSTRIVQECGIGLVELQRTGNRLSFAAPPLRRGGPLDASDLEQLTRGLGIEQSDIAGHAWCDNGPGWRALLLHDLQRLQSLRPDPSMLAACFTGLVARRPQDDECAFEVRAFFPGAGGALAEDPVTGSLNAALGQWLIGQGLAPARYVAAQGRALGRDGRVHVAADAEGAVWIGGDTVTCIAGTVDLA